MRVGERLDAGQTSVTKGDIRIVVSHRGQAHSGHKGPRDERGAGTQIVVNEGGEVAEEWVTGRIGEGERGRGEGGQTIDGRPRKGERGGISPRNASGQAQSSQSSQSSQRAQRAQRGREAGGILRECSFL